MASALVSVVCGAAIVLSHPIPSRSAPAARSMTDRTSLIELLTAGNALDAPQRNRWARPVLACPIPQKRDLRLFRLR